MFRPVAFDPYGRRRSRWRLPRWLVLLLCGIGIGAGGIVILQERYLPPRLSAQASTELRSAFDAAEAGRLRLTAEQAETAKRLQAALAEKKSLSDEVAAGRSTVEALREDVNSAIATLPPDPRGGAVEIRAARFVVKGAALAYDLVLTRERATAGKPITASMQFAMEGEAGRASTFTTPAIPVSIGSQQIVRGSVPLPNGFRPRQVTIQVADRVGGKALGMRVLLVR
jgi:hypothetical protein